MIVIGLDGLEPGIVEAMLGRGELPNLAKIQAAGSYSRLKTTYPAQTPVAWSSFVTGTNPGGHGIFDFICRDPETYLPDVALTRFERPKSMLAQPSRGKPAPGCSPVAATFKGRHSEYDFALSLYLSSRNLAGPDAGRSWAFPICVAARAKARFTPRTGRRWREENEQLVFLDSGSELATRVIGPRNTRTSPAADTFCEIRVQVDKAARKLVIHTGGSPAHD